MSCAIFRVKLQILQFTSSFVHPTWGYETNASYATDKRCKDLITQLSIAKNDTPNYKYHQGILRYKNRVVAGDFFALRKTVMTSLQISELGGHLDIELLARGSNSFYWPDMKLSIQEFVQQCPICQIDKSEHSKYPRLLQPLPTLEFAWAHITMNFVEGLPLSNNKNLVLMVMDRFRKYIHFIPMEHPISVKTVVATFIDNSLKFHGLPCVIVTGRERIFTNHLW